MKISDLGTILNSISKIHGDESRKVTIDAIQYEKGKTLHVSTSTDSVDVIASVMIDTKNEEEKQYDIRIQCNA